MQRFLRFLASVIWLFLIIILALIWQGEVRFTLHSMAIPYLILLLSLYVFNRTPIVFRRTHHCFVLPTLLISSTVSYYFTFHGGEQSGVGAYLLTSGAIVSYLIFISLFLLALTIRHFWLKSK